MSTPAILHVRQPDGAVKSVYVHNDGYPSHTGNVLKQYYNDNDKAQALVSNGSFSYLERQPENIEYHNDSAGRTLTATTLKKCIDKWNQRYNYYWDGAEWFFVQPFDMMFPLRTMSHKS